MRAGQTEVVTEPSQDEEERPAKGEVIDLMALLKKSVEEKAKCGGLRRRPRLVAVGRAAKPPEST